MIWKIARKEFLLNLMTFKFAVGVIVCVILMAVFMPTLVSDYQRRLKNYNENMAANEAELRNVKVYKNITPTVYRSPNLLSVFSEGVDRYLGNSEKIDINEESKINMEISETNPLLSVFPALDVTLIFKIVVSILAILMGYDVVSGEREQGTLKLMLSGTTARHQVLLGKLVAGLMTLIVPVTAAFIVGLLVLLPSDLVSLTGAQWLRIGLMYVASLIFVATMFNLGLFLSCLSKSSAISLVFGLFLWLFLAAILPNASAYVASQLRPIESAEEFGGKLKAVTDQRDSEIKELTRDIKGGGSESDAPDAFNQIYVMLCDKPFMEYHRKRYAITEPFRLKYLDKASEVGDSYLNDLVKQRQLADAMAKISPIVLYENLMAVLAGTDFDSFNCFKTNVKIYRNNVADYIRSQTQNFTSTSYFTPCKEGDWEDFWNFTKSWRQATDEAEKSKLWDVIQQNYSQKMKSTPSLSLQDFPEFICVPLSIEESLRQAIPALGLLIFTSVCFFSASFVVFLSYDVR